MAENLSSLSAVTDQDRLTTEEKSVENQSPLTESAGTIAIGGGSLVAIGRRSRVVAAGFRLGGAGAATSATAATLATVAARTTCATAMTALAASATTVAAFAAVATSDATCTTLALAAVAALARASVTTTTEGRSTLLTAHQGDTDDREEKRDPKNYNSIHPRILQKLTGTVSE